jgi:pilus assembly protein CpaE
MAQLAALIVSQDDEFRRRVGRLLQAGGVPVGIVHGLQAESAGPDLAVVDLRLDEAAGMALVEQIRAARPAVAIVAVARLADPDLILQAMRAGANEFVTWAASDAPGNAAQVMEDGFHGAVRRAASRRQATPAARPPSVTLAFVGAKGGAGTTTMAVNCAVELARQAKRSTLVVDLKPTLGEVALFLGVKPRFNILDALENLHRLDPDFISELVSKHRSGLDVLAGSEQFERPGPQDAGAIEEFLRQLGQVYDFIVVDAGNAISTCTVAGLHAADTIFLIANPDVPSIRNAQRVVERVRQLGAGSERVKVVLNRYAEHLMIGPRQIEAALGYSIHQVFTSDYKAVSTALNSGVPLTLARDSEVAAEFDRFTRQIIEPGGGGPAPEPEKKRRLLKVFDRSADGPLKSLGLQGISR